MKAGFSSGLFAVLLAGCCPPGAPFPNCATDGGNAGPAAWTTVLDLEDLDGAVLSVWGTGTDTVFAVGGPVGNQAETLAVLFSGGGWKRLHPGGQDTYWWVHGTSASDVWMVGEHGRISHWNGNAFSEHTSGVTATLWGVMAFSANDVWAVGGTPGEGTNEPNDIVLHYDGTNWSPETLPGNPRGSSLFKVWGTSASDLYVVGEHGTIWHRTASGWTLESAQYTPPLASGTLFTVHGCSSTDVWAVGGNSVLHSDGTTWSKVPVTLNSQVNGVSCGPDGAVALVGFGGMKMRRVNGEFVDESEIEPYNDLHAAWIDPAGTVWASGGDWLAPAGPGRVREGVVARYGSGTVSATVTP
ncbi:MAG: hypothetical protein AB2A00_39545 [Myxococcota bacterium]